MKVYKTLLVLEVLLAHGAKGAVPKINRRFLEGEAVVVDGQECPGGSDRRRLNGAGATISNGLIRLGVNQEGDLNYASVGLRYIFPDLSENEAIYHGCLCEGWGAGADGDAAYFSRSNGFSGASSTTFAHTADTAVSTVVSPGGKLRITHDFHPSTATSNLYEIKVTLENISGGDISEVRYRRVMDWDISPTIFHECVTIQPAPGTIPYYYAATDNGFNNVNPYSTLWQILSAAPFTDLGPEDHGAAFDFRFGALKAGHSGSFYMYYGAGDSQADAESALASVDAPVYSFAKYHSDVCSDTPNTFIFAVTPSIEASMDIKFCSNPNGFNCKSKGVLPITVFGTAAFDVQDIVMETVHLCLSDESECLDYNALRDYVFKDRGSPSDVGASQCAIIDEVEQDYLNRDGYLDLELVWEKSDVVETLLDDCCGLTNGAAGPSFIFKATTMDGVEVYTTPAGNSGIDQLYIQNGAKDCGRFLRA